MSVFIATESFHGAMTFQGCNEVAEVLRSGDTPTIACITGAYGEESVSRAILSELSDLVQETPDISHNDIVYEAMVRGERIGLERIEHLREHDPNNLIAFWSWMPKDISSIPVDIYTGFVSSVDKDGTRRISAFKGPESNIIEDYECAIPLVVWDGPLRLLDEWFYGAPWGDVEVLHHTGYWGSEKLHPSASIHVREFANTFDLHALLPVAGAFPLSPLGIMDSEAITSLLEEVGKKYLRQAEHIPECSVMTIDEGGHVEIKQVTA